MADALAREFDLTSVATGRAEFADDYPVFSLAFSPTDVQIATSSPYSEEVHIWTWQGDSPRLVLKLHQRSAGHVTGGGGLIDALRYSPIGCRLVAAHVTSDQDYRMMRAWDLSNGAVVADIAEKFGTMQRGAFAFTPDGRLLLRAKSGVRRNVGGTEIVLDSLVVNDAKTGEQLWSLKSDPFMPEGLAVSADGRYVALTGSERRQRGGEEYPYLQYRVVVIDLSSRSVILSADIPSAYMSLIAWSPDGRRITVVGNKLVIVDAKTGKLLLEKAAPAGGVPVGVVYTPDGQRLLVGASDGVEIWDATHTRLLQKIQGRFVHALSLSSDGRYLALADDHRISVWALKGFATSNKKVSTHQ